MGKNMKSEKYKGRTINFDRMTGGVLAKAPSLTRQYIGFGKTKATAFAEAKKIINRLNKVKKKRR